MKHIAIITIVFIFSSIFLGISSGIVAADGQLAQQYAPIFYFEKNEMVYPVDISYHLDNSYLYQYTSNQTILLSTSPTAEEIGNYSTEEFQDFFLDNQIGSIDDEAIISDYQNLMNSLGFTVYSHVYEYGVATIIQYWMFYPFNRGPLNIHEGDWEMVQVVLTEGQPSAVMYSQHLSGQKATWEQVEHDGDHIKVYVARGTHANYLRSYSGVLGASSDIVGDNGRILRPGEYTIELVESQAWLNFSGRWGEYGGPEDEVRGKVGPFGPKYREDGQMWNNPIAWGDELSQANDMLFLGEWFLYNFVSIFIIITIVTLLISVLLIYRRHRKYGLGPRIISMLYIDGFNLKSIGNILCMIAIVLAIFSLFYQWYGVSIDINASNHGTTGFIDIIVIDGLNGVQINLLDPNAGIVQLGSFVLPFSLLIGISLVFLVIKTIGVSKSTKLGRKYIFRGVGLALYIIFILIGMMALGFLYNSMGMSEPGEAGVSQIIDSISSNPFGGTTTVPLEIEGAESSSLSFRWGIGIGGLLLLLSGVLLIIAGFIEIIALTTFFEEKHIALRPKKMKKSIKDKDEKSEISQENQND